MIPTLAARSRQRQLQDLALGRTRTPSQVEPEQPLALLSYLQTGDSSVAGIEPPCTVEHQPQQPEHDAIRTTRTMPSWMELLIWLALLLMDGALALLDLLRNRPGPAIDRSRNKTGKSVHSPANSWLAADLPPASLV